jgi:hypothetical protein
LNKPAVRGVLTPVSCFVADFSAHACIKAVLKFLFCFIFPRQVRSATYGIAISIYLQLLSIGVHALFTGGASPRLAV